MLRSGKPEGLETKHDYLMAKAARRRDFPPGASCECEQRSTLAAGVVGPGRLKLYEIILSDAGS